jgi:ABC-2 type transport system permease protein
MNIQNVWSVASKDFEVYRRKKSIIYSMIILPLFVAVLFALYIREQAASGIGSTFSLGLESITYVSVVLAAVLPGSLAAYSIVGEKVEKSFEPLLSTPLSDGEILLGKSVGAFIPPILAVWGGASIFMAATDYFTHNGLSYYYFPNWDSGIMLLLLAPLASIFSIEMTVIASSRLSDVRSANQIGGLMFVPFMLVFVEGVTGAFTFDPTDLLIFSGALLIVDVALFFLSTSTFRREKILTKWK